jgi:hypothetical protein
MKKLIRGLLLGGLMLALLPAGLKAEPARSAAVTVKVSGDVTVQTDGGAEEALARGARLNDGDRIRTGADGRAVLVFTDDKSQLKLTPLTDLVLHADREGGRVDKEVEMSVGTLWSKVTRQEGEFRIATPTSVASVKGTAWWTRASSEGTTVITEEGIVELLSRESGASVDVVMGQTGESNASGATVRPSSPEDQQGLERGELKRIEIPVSQDGENRTLIIEYYE